MIDRVTGARAAYQLVRASRREGGQAEVFEARSPTGVSYAVRVPRGGDTAWFHRELAAIEGVFRRSRDAASWLVSVVDSGTLEDGRPFFVMPWYASNLSEWLRRQPPLELRLRALELASRAVARLHHSGEDELDLVVHRDLKPSNFLLREGDLAVLLSDLGAARTGALYATAANTVIYTRNYAPPEQQLPIPLPADPSLDVHALGVTVYWGLVGRIPASVINREALRTARGARLLALHAHGAERRPEEEEEFQDLSRLPLGALFDLETARALFPSDEALLTSALCDQLAARHADPEAVADRLFQKLVPALRRALEPDPARRLGDARVLQAACHHALEVLVSEGLAASTPPVTTVAAVEAPTMAVVTGPDRAAPRRARGIGVGVGVAATLIVALGLGWRLLGPASGPPAVGTPAAPAPAPVAAPLSVTPPTDLGATSPAPAPASEPASPNPERAAAPPRASGGDPGLAVAPAKVQSSARVPPTRDPDVTAPPPPTDRPDVAVQLRVECPDHLSVILDGRAEECRRCSLEPGSHVVRVFDDGLVAETASLRVSAGRITGSGVSETDGAFLFSCHHP